ncbi:glycoside hydrolase family 2 TIM barrel-domain containing protein [Chitinophaga sp. RAB17]|uniref:glycoside hydrolase family 2 TIM barrel-domain containing protein n=1 Tax=Chitinophaga sp. RAB17 TaxID=3233049 RepID=UPI003F935710
MIKKGVLFGSWLLLSLSAWAQTEVAKFDIPRLSPRPTTVKGVAVPLLSLNGNWSFSNGLAGTAAPIAVPGEWVMQGFQLNEGDTAIYRRDFQVPADWQGNRVMIRFDGISSWGKVLINGKVITEHEGGFVPFEADITDALQAGDNRLEVQVQALTVSDKLGCVSQYAVHTVGGILRKATLFVLPVANIKRLDVTTRLSKDYTNGTLDMDMRTTTANGNMHYRLTDASGKTVLDKTLALYEPQQLPVGRIQTWNPESPYLYTLTASLIRDGQVLEAVTQKVGFREVKVSGSLLLVNGKPVKLHGVNRHDVHPLLGRSITPELSRQDAELFKKGNCNYIRTSHYPPSEEFLAAADEVGLFVESESAICWIQHGAAPLWKLWNYKDEKYLPYFIRANVEKVNAQRNHPSIIIWSLANESLWSPLFVQVNAIVKAIDPTRPTTFHDQCWGGFNNAHSQADIAVYHYPGINGAAATDTMKRPVLFGEYAHVSCYNRRELLTDPGIRAAYGAPLASMYDSMYHHPNCLGGAIWAGIDDIFHLPDGRIVGYGPWGPVDAWRREKPEFYGMRKAYAPVVVTNMQAPVVKGKQLFLNVENRFDFTTLTAANIHCSIDGQAVKITGNIAPHGAGTLQVPVSVSSGVVDLSFTDPAGKVVNEERITLKAASVAPATAPVRLSYTQNEQAYTIQQGDHTFEISRLTGLIVSAKKGEHTILSQGPVWSVVPMNSEDGGKPNVAGETYQNNIYPLKNYPLYTLFATSLEIAASDSGIVVKEAVTYTAAKGTIRYHFRPDNKVSMTYEMHYRGEDSLPRQYGMLLQLPATFDHLSWTRKGSFSVYPADDIARNEGSATLQAQHINGVEPWGKVPAGKWKDDANEMGSNDFRSTKRHILLASLKDAAGNGITIVSDGHQSARSWLQDAHLQLLIADYSNNGSEPFYGSPFTDKQHKLPSLVKGELVFTID